MKVEREVRGGGEESSLRVIQAELGCVNESEEQSHAHMDGNTKWPVRDVYRLEEGEGTLVA